MIAIDKKWGKLDTWRVIKRENGVNTPVPIISPRSTPKRKATALLG